MAKGQKKSNREIRKPKKEKPKEEAGTRSFLEVASGKQGGGAKHR